MEDFVNNFVNIIYVIIDAIRSLVESLRGEPLLKPKAEDDQPADDANN